MKINASDSYYNNLNDNDRYNQAIVVSGEVKQTPAMGMDILELSQSAIEINTRKKIPHPIMPRKWLRPLRLREG